MYDIWASKFPHSSFIFFCQLVFFLVTIIIFPNYPLKNYCGFQLITIVPPGVPTEIGYGEPGVTGTALTVVVDAVLPGLPGLAEFPGVERPPPPPPPPN
jgi:hypothetical protein